MSKRKRKSRVAPTLVKRVKVYDDAEIVELTEEGMEALYAQLQAFRDKFGREPGPSDPVFFDPDEDEPTPMSAEKMRRLVLEASVQAGQTPKRGLELYEWMGSDEHRALLEDEGLRERHDGDAPRW